MKTKVIVIENDSNLDKLLKEPAQALKRGELVVFPTETVYGLGANALDPEAVESIFVVKNRPQDNPLIMHIANPEDLYLYADEMSPFANFCVENFMPGPLTLIVKRKDFIPDIVTGGLDTVGIRCPDHSLARTLIRLAQCPVAAPSANVSGRPSPTQVQDVLEDIDGRVPYVIDGGICSVGVESTILDVSTDAPVLLRPGLISKEELEKLYEDKMGHKIKILEKTTAGQSETPQAPGMKYRHYAPSVPVSLIPYSDFKSMQDQVRTILEKENEKAKKQGSVMKIGLYISDSLLKDLPPFSNLEYSVYSFGAFDDTHLGARYLYLGLRYLDRKQVSQIFVQALPDEGVGQAYLNRVSKSIEAKDEPKEILFVCTGNTCRSPMAQAIFLKIIQDEGLEHLFNASSAGTGAMPGDMASIHTIAVLEQQYGLKVDEHRSRRISPYIMEEASLVLTMTRSQSDYLKNEYLGLQDKIFSIYEYLGDETQDVLDPYGSDLSVYQETGAEIFDLINKIIKKLNP